VQPILEVIALDAVDARAAQEGGADRIELVTAMARDGLTPDLETFVQVRAATDLPVRVMLRDCDGFGAGSAGDLRARASALRAAGADEFVLGFLDDSGAVAVPDLTVLDGCSWTFHRALDHARDRAAAWGTIRTLPGVDFVLTAGSPDGVSAGLEVLLAEASAGGPRIMAGGGLRPEHVAPLRAAGIDAFHVGAGVRRRGWDTPVDAALVREWRSTLRR
jgi:copper homeostasis protein